MNEDLYSEETRKFMPEEKKASIKAEVFSWVKVIVSAIIIALLVDFFIIANAVVPTGSMETTIPAGSRIMGLRLYYDFNEPERGDIVIFKYPDDESVDYLKRIIGLPGETVQVKDGYVYINGEKLESDIYGKEVMQSAGIAAEPITLGDDEYFVLGDNRNNSSDSRDPSVGILKRKDLLGRAWVRIYPFDKVGVIRHE